VRSQITADAPVASVFGRTGAVISATNDYAFSQISGTVGNSQLPSVGTSGTYGDGTHSLTVTTDTQGRVSAVSTNAIVLPLNTTASATQFFTAYNATTGAFTKAQPAFTDISGTATTAQIPSLAASKITSGQLALAQGGTNADLSATGGTSFFLRQNSVGAAVTVVQPAFTDISGTASTGQIPNLAASKITSGQIALAQGGTNADLSATGGAHKFLRQNSVGAAIDVIQLAAADLSDGTTGSGGAVVLATGPTIDSPNVTTLLNLGASGVILRGPSAATLALGAADAASPVAQNVVVQNVATGTSNIAGANLTINASQGTGTGAGGSIVFKAAAAGNSGTAQNALNTILTLKDSGTAGASKPQLLAAPGTAALPSYSSTVDTGSGFNVPATNNATISIAGAARLSVTASAQIVLDSAYPIGWSDAWLLRCAAGCVQLGLANAASPVGQTIGFQGSRGGTDSNVAGAAATIQSSLGTGNAAGAQVSISRALMGGSGSTQQTAANAITVCESKTLSNTSATATTIATIGSASNSAGGITAFITVTASDGTNFDAETQSLNVSFVNKAGTFTISTPTITGSSAASNSGSVTIGATVTGAASLISLKVTPVFTTIVPTTVTVYTEIHNHSAGAVACQ
jgi:hypothetical protein